MGDYTSAYTGVEIDNVIGAFSGAGPNQTFYALAAAANQGAASADGDETVKDFVDSLGSNVGTIILKHGSAGTSTDYIFSTSETIPSNITLVVETGAHIVDDANNADLTINGPMEAGLYQIFDWGNGTGNVLFGEGAVEGVRPEWYGGLGDDSTDCTAAFAEANATAANGVVAYGRKQNILLSAGVYRVTATSGNYAITSNAPIVGQGAEVSQIYNVGTGSALHIVGINGEIYYSRWKNFSVVGQATSENGIVLNVTATLGLAVGYSIFENIDSHHHGGHGLLHDGSWATKYINCKFNRNSGLGVYLPGTGAYSQHNNVIFQNCDSRWNGGTGDNSADYTKGGVRISGIAHGVYWLGGVVESNNAWGFIIGEDATYTVRKVVLRNVYGEGHPHSTFTSATGGFLRVSSKYQDVSIADSTINYGAPTGKTGYAFYINDVAENEPGFREWNNYVEGDLAAGTATRDVNVVVNRKWGSDVELITPVANRDFSGTPNWANGDFGTFDTSGDLSIVATGAQSCSLNVLYLNSGAGFAYGKRYSLTYDASSATGTLYFASIAKLTKLPFIINGTGQTHEFMWQETNANQNLYIYSDGASTVNLDNLSIREIDGGVAPQTKREGLLSITNVGLDANADTTLFTVPTGKRCVLSHAILVAGADAGATSTMSIGADGAETDFVGVQTLTNLDAQYDSVIIMPVPNATPVKTKSYAAGTIIQAQVANQSGGAANTLFLYGTVY